MSGITDFIERLPSRDRLFYLLMRSYEQYVTTSVNPKILSPVYEAEIGKLLSEESKVPEENIFEPRVMIGEYNLNPIGRSIHRGSPMSIQPLQEEELSSVEILSKMNSEDQQLHPDDDSEIRRDSIDDPMIDPFESFPWKMGLIVLH